jgi:hypothetical protein
MKKQVKAEAANQLRQHKAQIDKAMGLRSKIRRSGKDVTLVYATPTGVPIVSFHLTYMPGWGDVVDWYYRGLDYDEATWKKLAYRVFGE